MPSSFNDETSDQTNATAICIHNNYQASSDKPKSYIHIEHWQDLFVAREHIFSIFHFFKNFYLKFIKKTTFTCHGDD